ncbi:MerR family transcriptional regulator [Candidatus Amarobacter glycogenicus]|uniref:MerR family transcriptional regulator n=1 Tax=Candidatus Amarobacter glycogenicus TaxID=3140699 RepID=UPI002A10236C|nr:MerR family transcriptional regulator [Dehalococcoidia bacterium]
MKISELSSRTGVSIPSLKFYLREGLLPQGQLSAPNQADYSESHVRRAALIRALRDVAGLSIAKIKAIVDALEHRELYEVMGQAVDSLGGETIAEFTPAQSEAAVEVDRLLGAFGLPAREEFPRSASDHRRVRVGARNALPRRARGIPGALCTGGDRDHDDRTGRDAGTLRPRT